VGLAVTALTVAIVDDGRPPAIDLGERAAHLGVSATERGAALRSLPLPDTRG
jgi:hypothetical protein